MSSGRGWLRYEPSDAAVALLCLPHAGGGAASFNGWLNLFPPAVAPVRVQLPGREDLAAQPPLRRADAAAAALMAQLNRLIDIPVALYGHSMGALIAFELAHTLTAAGTPPTHLFLSGRRAPHLKARHAPIHHLPDQEFLVAMERMGAAMGSAGRSAAVLRYALPLIRADLELSEGYVHRPGRRLGCPVTVFAGTGDPMVGLTEAEAWQDQTDGAFALHTFPGDHFFHQRHREAIAARIVQALSRDPSLSLAQGVG